VRNDMMTKEYDDTRNMNGMEWEFSALSGFAFVDNGILPSRKCIARQGHGFVWLS
jgi:hypothetical protein